MTLPTAGTQSLATPILYTVAEGCALLRISRWTFYRLVHARELTTITIGSRRFVPATAITAYIERQIAAGGG